MTDYYWPDVRDELIELFSGELPVAKTEAEIIDAFKNKPRTVINVGHQLAAQQGERPRSYWAVLRSRVAGANTTGQPVTANDETERVRKIRNASNWIRNAGVYFGIQDDLEDELFGRTGMLRSLDTPELRQQMLELWEHEREQFKERRANEEPPGEYVYRQLQWKKARTLGERWANHDETWEGYEDERKAGRRPFWKGEGPPAYLSWPKPQAAEAPADDYGPPELVRKERAA